MNIGFRVFFLEEDGSLRDIPWQTYVSLYSGSPSVRFPEYSGKAVRGVHVVVELENRVPISILESIFFITYFGPDGGMDQEKKVERQRIAGGQPEDSEEEASPRPETPCMPFLSCRQERGAESRRPGSASASRGQRVIDLLPRLSEKCHEKARRWVLTVEETENLERRVEEFLDI